jgi:hypothetical protein
MAIFARGWQIVLNVSSALNASRTGRPAIRDKHAAMPSVLMPLFAP